MGRFGERGSSWAEGAGHGRGVALGLGMSRLGWECRFCSVYVPWLPMAVLSCEILFTHSL